MEFDRTKEGTFNPEENKLPEVPKETFPIVIKLKHPFMFEKKDYSEVMLLRWPNEGACGHLSATDAVLWKRGHFWPIAAYMADVHEEFFRQMSAADFSTVILEISRFL